MQRGLTFVALLAGTAVVGAFLGPIVDQTKEVQIRTVEAVDASSDSRRWLPWNATPREKWNLGGSSESLITALRAHETEGAYALTLPEGAIWRSAATGSLARTFDPSKGNGFPIDFDVNSSGELIVLIANEDVVRIFAADGALSGEIELDEPGLRISAAMERGFVTLSAAGKGHLLRYRSRDGADRAFGKLLEADAQTAHLIQGSLAATTDDRVLYASDYFDLVGSFSPRDAQGIVMRGVGDYSPKIVSVDGARLVAAPGSPLRGLNVAAVADAALVLVGTSEPQERILDVYSLGAEPGYRCSMRLPGRPRVIAATESAVYTAEGLSVTHWTGLDLSDCLKA